MSRASPWPRRATRQIRLGSLPVGGNAPLVVQSMLSVSPAETELALAELSRLALAGCDVVRVALPDRAALAALPTLVAATSMPLVADIHFNPDLGIAALEEGGVAGLRINPGTWGDNVRLPALARAALATGACIRVGANAGSPSRAARAHPRGLLAGLVADVLETARRLADAGLCHVKLSVKSARVPELITVTRLLAEGTDRIWTPGWPLHLGLTEAGPPPGGELKSAAALAILLAEGLGDTLRVSLSADPVWEVRAAHRLLRALGLSDRGVDLVACPTCGRKRGDVIAVVRELQAKLEHLETDVDRKLPSGITLAVMGCEVNGPNEARAADVGVAATKDGWLLFSRGHRLGHVEHEEVVERLVALSFALPEDGSPSDS